MSDPFDCIVPRDKVTLSPSCGSIIALKDGRLMWAWGSGSPKPIEPLRVNFSEDGGRSWTDPVAVRLESGEELTSVIGPSLCRLPSGELGLVHEADIRRGSHYLDATYVIQFHTSADEGQTWSRGIEVSPNTRGEAPSLDCAMVLSDGRLVLPYQKIIGPTPTAENYRMCRKFGREFSNCFSYNLHFSFCYYSDDEGKTWQRSRNEVIATIDRGVGGCYCMAEPQIAELADGRLIMIANTTLGRLYRSYSEDRGETWAEAEPTDLALRRSPLALQRVPDSDDLLLIWSQISAWEAMNGVYRHRLSCAVSKDGGLTWQHHKNLVSLDDVSYLEPGPIEFHVLEVPKQPLDRQRYHRAPGPLRNDHPYCTFHDGHAIIVYGRGVLGDRSVIEKTYGMNWDEVCESLGFEPRAEGSFKVLGNNRLHVIPIDWFYEDAAE